MGLTQNHQLPYPELGDPPDVVADFYELAKRIDAVLAEFTTELTERVNDIEERVERIASAVSLPAVGDRVDE